MRATCIVLFISLIGLPAMAGDSPPVRGAAAVLEWSPNLQLNVPGQDEMELSSMELPHYIPGLFSTSAEGADTLFIRTSNDLNLFFQGPGFYALERFESILKAVPGETQALEETQSRMILNLRRGLLIVDSRQLDEESQFILEVPFGRVSGARALWFIQIEFDNRSGIYDFTIACSEGLVRLTDRSKESYIIYPGQRLAGAGSYVAPAIEVGEHTDQSRERFERFSELLVKHDAAELDQKLLREQMAAVTNVPLSTPGFLQQPTQSTGKRPIVIEFSPQAPQLTPFRGEMRPPSDYQADIF